MAGAASLKGSYSSSSLSLPDLKNFHYLLEGRRSASNSLPCIAQGAGWKHRPPFLRRRYRRRAPGLLVDLCQVATGPRPALSTNKESRGLQQTFCKSKSLRVWSCTRFTKEPPQNTRLLGATKVSLRQTLASGASNPTSFSFTRLHALLSGHVLAEMCQLTKQDGSCQFSLPKAVVICSS